MPQVAGLLLAAGAGRRMGRPKALLRRPDGTAWVVAAVRALQQGGCSPVVVVVGAAGDEVAALLPPGVQVVTAVDWSQGMGASLRAGLTALLDPPRAPSAPSAPSAPPTSSAPGSAPGTVAALVSLVDLPGVDAQVVARVAALAAPSALARAAYHGRPGHPVLLGCEHWPGVRTSAAGDVGARGYLAGRDVVLVECGDVGHSADLDTPDDVAAAYGDRVSTEASAADTSRLHAPARRVVLTAITEDPLDVAAHEAAVADPGAGAVVTFTGAVRDHDGGRAVTGIEYVAHPTVAQVLEQVAAEVAAGSEVEALAVSHRVGPLAVGEAAIVVAVSGAHRQEAFATATRLVEEVKHRLPVWKHQHFADGTDEWVACP